MSDSEIHYYYILTLEQESQVFTDFVAILFAFVVAGYFFAHNLSRSLTVLVVGTYGLIQTLIFFNMLGLTETLSGLFREMKTRKAGGSDSFDWLKTLNASDAVVMALNIGTLLVIILALLGSIWFFFQRHTLAENDSSDQLPTE